jgi:hypothetical protein
MKSIYIVLKSYDDIYLPNESQVVSVLRTFDSPLIYAWKSALTHRDYLYSVQEWLMDTNEPICLYKILSSKLLHDYTESSIREFMELLEKDILPLQLNFYIDYKMDKSC